MSSPRRLVLPAALTLLAALALPACTGGNKPAQGGAAASAAASPAVSGVGVVAEVDGAPILGSELEQKAASRLSRLRQEEYEIRKQALEELVGERLLAAEAKKRGISTEELVRLEVGAKAEPAPEATIVMLYEQNKQRFGATPREQALSRIRELVAERSQAERRAAFERELRERSRVAIRLDPPRAKVTIPDGTPSTGPAAAPVAIVEFTDYQCPFCHRAQSVVDQLLQRYQGKVRFVHMDFPLEGHPRAVPAATAARCAGEQGRFWEYHRGLMTSPGPLDEADLHGRAGRLGLDAPRFAQCLASPRYQEAIRASFEQGEALGVTGTPAYFVNGRMLSGARPLADFVEVIEAELAGHS